MIKAAEKASKSAIRDFGEVERLQVSKKGPYDFVTKTDKHVEKILIENFLKQKKLLISFGRSRVRLIIKIKKMYGSLILLMEQQTFFTEYLILQSVLLFNLRMKL